MCCLLVSAFFTEITQQIHSLRASGVISSHFARAAESEMRTFRKSAGTLCTAPGEIPFLVMDFILHRLCRSSSFPRSRRCEREKELQFYSRLWGTKMRSDEERLQRNHHAIPDVFIRPGECLATFGR